MDEFELLARWNEQTNSGSASFQPFTSTPSTPPPRNFSPSSFASWLSVGYSRYEDWLLREAPSVSKLESFLQIACNFTPGGSTDAAVELKYTILGLFTLLNDFVTVSAVRKLLSASPSTSSRSAQLSELLTLLRKQKFDLQHPLVHLINVLLGFIRSVQLLAEMFVVARAPHHTRKLILAVEGAKAVLKLALLYISGATTIHDALPPRPQNEILVQIPDLLHTLPPITSSSYSISSSSSSSSSSSVSSHTTTSNNNTNNSLNGNTLQSRFVNGSLSRMPTAAKSQYLLAEVLYIARPLVFVLAQQKSGTKSWAPWVLSLSIDFWSHLAKGKLVHSNSFEKSIHSARLYDLFWYLLRSPMGDKTVEFVMKVLIKLRMPQFVLNLVQSMLILYSTYHFYSSKS